MKTAFNRLARWGAVLLVSAVAVGCAARPAPDFWGRWNPVNRYAETPQAIALQQQYLFYASPLDGTLKNMLARWAQDAKMSLSYRHPSDFTLHTAVAGVRTPDLASATAQVSRAYIAQGISVDVEGNQIVVRTLVAAPAGGAVSHASSAAEHDAP